MTRTLEERTAVAETQIANLEADVGEIKADVKAILAEINKTKGGWKVIVMVAGVAGSAGALIGKLLPFWIPK